MLAYVTTTSCGYSVTWLSFYSFFQEINSTSAQTAVNLTNTPTASRLISGSGAPKRGWTCWCPRGPQGPGSGSTLDQQGPGWTAPRVLTLFYIPPALGARLIWKLVKAQHLSLIVGAASRGSRHVRWRFLIVCLRSKNAPKVCPHPRLIVWMPLHLPRRCHWQNRHTNGPRGPTHLHVYHHHFKSSVTCTRPRILYLLRTLLWTVTMDPCTVDWTAVRLDSTAVTGC